MEGSRTPEPPAKRDTPWRLILFGVLAVYAFLLVIFNLDEQDISFVFFTASISLFVLILLCLGVGFVTGFLFDRMRERRKRRASAG
jgi:uncharacterized integral membrane protein